MVLIFLAGITKLKGQSVTKVLSTQNIRMYWGVATDETKDSREQHQNRFELCVHLVHEAQSQLACSALAKSIQDQMLEYRFSGNFQLNIIAYFISQSGCSWEYVYLDIVEDRWYPICFNTFVSHLQIPSRNTSIRRLSILYFNDKSTGLYPLPNMLWSLLKLKTSILNDVRYLSAGQSDNINEVNLSAYEVPSNEEITLILKNLENLEHIYLESIGLNRKVTEKLIIPLVLRCKQTLKTLYLNSLMIEENTPFSIELFVNLTSLAIQNSLPIEHIHLDIGPIPLYPNELALKIFNNACLSAARLLFFLKQLRSLNLNCRLQHEQQQQRELSMIQGRVCSPNVFLEALADSQKLRYLRLDSYFLLNSKAQKLCAFLTRNQSLKVLNIDLAFDDAFLSPELLKQLTEGLKQNKGLEILQVFLMRGNPQLFQKFVSQLLRSLHHHPKIKTLILERAYDQMTDIKPLSELLLYNSKISKVDIKRFTLNDIKSMVPCLVFNGRRAEFDYSLYKGEYPRIIDQDIEEKSTVLNILCLVQC